MAAPTDYFLSLRVRGSPLGIYAHPPPSSEGGFQACTGLCSYLLTHGLCRIHFPMPQVRRTVEDACSYDSPRVFDPPPSGRGAPSQSPSVTHCHLRWRPSSLLRNATPPKGEPRGMVRQRGVGAAGGFTDAQCASLQCKNLPGACVMVWVPVRGIFGPGDPAPTMAAHQNCPLSIFHFQLSTYSHFRTDGGPGIGGGVINASFTRYEPKIAWNFTPGWAFHGGKIVVQYRENTNKRGDL